MVCWPPERRSTVLSIPIPPEGARAGSLRARGGASVARGCHGRLPISIVIGWATRLTDSTLSRSNGRCSVPVEMASDVLIGPPSSGHHPRYHPDHHPDHHPVTTPITTPITTPALRWLASCDRRTSLAGVDAADPASRCGRTVPRPAGARAQAPKRRAQTARWLGSGERPNRHLSGYRSVPSSLPGEERVLRRARPSAERRACAKLGVVRTRVLER